MELLKQTKKPQNRQTNEQKKEVGPWSQWNHPSDALLNPTQTIGF